MRLLIAMVSFRNFHITMGVVFILCFLLGSLGVNAMDADPAGMELHEASYRQEMLKPRILDQVDFETVIDERDAYFPFIVYRIRSKYGACLYLFKSQRFSDHIRYSLPIESTEVAGLFIQRFRGILNDLELGRWRPDVGLVPHDISTFEVYPLLAQMRLLDFAIMSLEKFLLKSGEAVIEPMDAREAVMRHFWKQSQWPEEKWKVTDDESLDLFVCRSLETNVLLDGQMADLPFVIYDIRCGTARRFIYRGVNYWDFVPLSDELLSELDRDQIVKKVASFFIERLRGIAHDHEHGRMRENLPHPSWVTWNDYLVSAERFREAADSIQDVLSTHISNPKNQTDVQECEQIR